MTDLFTGDAFIDLPAQSIEDDCAAWFVVFEACLIFAYDNGAFSGDENDVLDAVIDAQSWLIDTDCTTI
jgi:hypothetical protein